MKSDDDDRIITKSLSSLIKRFSTTNVVENIEKEYSNSFHSAIPLSQIDDTPFIKNVRINQEELQKTIDSLNTEIISPLVVIKNNEDRYEVVYPRNLYYAAKKEKIEKLNCFVIDVSEEEKLLIMSSYMKNSKSSSAVELSYVLNRLYHRYHISQADLASIMSCSRSQITNILRIRRLPASVINHLVDGDISLGHVRALMTLKDEDIIKYVDYILEYKLSVRDTERLIYNLKHDYHYDELLSDISDIYDCKVTLNNKKITLSFRNEKEFQKGIKKLARTRTKRALNKDLNSE